MNRVKGNHKNSMSEILCFPQHAAIERIVRETAEIWPDHVRFLERRFQDNSKEELDHFELLAQDIIKLASSNLRLFCENYRWMSEQFVNEELFFRRSKRYRLSTLAEAKLAVYDNPDFMSRYMSGLLVSQLLWSNHAGVFGFFLSEFLGPRTEPFDYLEIGPGHGLFLAHAATHPFCRSAHGWDISSTSLQATGDAISRLGVDGRVRLALRDVAATDSEETTFDAIVISEVLEHVEQPEVVLAGLLRFLRPGGEILVNVPVNSPAPDHIYLWRRPEEIVEFVEASGVVAATTRLFPATGVTLDRARKNDLTISCVVIGRKPK
jgi:2-polyprenyl-3-methyl-5-hydroxy-6-metoxy-1,4-benzoquinol methylase